MKRAITTMFLIASLALPGLADTNELDLADQLWATSNMWGVAAERVKYRYSVVPSLLARMYSDERYESTLHDWYCSLLQYDDYFGKDWAWCSMKGELLQMSAHLRAVSTSTNAWLKTADYLGLLRDTVASQTNRVLSSVEDWIAYSQEDGSNFRSRWNIRYAVKDSEPRMLNVVTNVFPRRILPQLDEAERMAIVSNIAERARLTEAEVSVLWPTNVVAPVATE